MISRRIGGVIGLAREAGAHRQTSRATSPLPHHQEPSDKTGSTEERHNEQAGEGLPPFDEADETAWALDEVERSEFSGVNSFDDAQDDDQLIQMFQQRHPPPAYARSTATLPFPVCIPQRRPRHRTRGFVRAYAPVLEECGIDQDTFLDFLAGFEKAIKVGNESPLNRGDADSTDAPSMERRPGRHQGS